MAGWWVLAGGSFVSLCFLPFVSVHSATHHMSIVQRRGEIWSKQLYAGMFGGGNSGHFWKVVIFKWCFYEMNESQWLAFSSYQYWDLKAKFVFLYHDPGIPFPKTMQLFSFCQHTLPLGFAAAMENSIKQG